MDLSIYGLPNCDQTRAAVKWLKEHKINFTFIDYRKKPVTNKIIDSWVSKAGISKVLNRQSKTWRELPEESKNQPDAIALLEAYPTLIKRPVLVKNETILTGFNEKEYLLFFGLE